MRRALALAFSCAAALLARDAAGHGMRSAYLEVTELDGGRAALRLSTAVPSSGLRVLAPSGCGEGAATAALLIVTCPGGLAGRELRVEGIGPIVSEVVVRVTFAGGQVAARVLSASSAAWTLPRARDAALVLADYARMGLVHIFTGFDHLLFLAALALALGQLRAIFIAETAFTASHTLTFTASALGLLRVSSAAAEACIALSLVLVALDAAEAHDARPGGPRASVARAAALAFAFGLVHGLGFAGGLAEIGLPDRAIGWALAGFAGGVELGQVLFLCAFVFVLARARRARGLSGVPLAVVYFVGATGAFLFFARIATLLHRTMGGPL
jgi:hypothetical protein